MKIIVPLFFLIVTGCSQTIPYRGQGEDFALKYRNVVYRDLTIPVQRGNEDEKVTFTTIPALN